jgi:hypothetical protein
MTKSEKTPHSEWAVTKVEDFTPAGKEKSTLIAIASMSDPDGSGCFAKIETIASRCGHSIRTVQSHIRSMQSRCSLPRIGKEDDGSDCANAELRVKFQAKAIVRTNKYHINVCRKASVPKSQLKLPLKTILEKSTKTAESILATTGLTKSSSGHLPAKPTDPFEGIVEISPATEEFIRSTTESLRVAKSSYGHNPELKRLSDQAQADRLTIERERTGRFPKMTETNAHLYTELVPKL